MPNRPGLLSATFAHPISVSAEYRLPDEGGDTGLIDAGRTERSGIVTGTGAFVRVRDATCLLFSVSCLLVRVPSMRAVRLRGMEMTGAQARLDWIAQSARNKAHTYVEISDKVWELAELRFAEHGAVAAQIEALEEEGFTITRNVAGMPTAFAAEAGSGAPIIGFLGEYDALAGLSQEAGASVPRPLEDGKPGQGCGHNLLGAGSMLAAVLVKEYLAENRLSGTVRYYGCPGEEGGSG